MSLTWLRNYILINQVKYFTIFSERMNVVGHLFYTNGNGCLVRDNGSNYFGDRKTKFEQSYLEFPSDFSAFKNREATARLSEVVAEVSGRSERRFLSRDMNKARIDFAKEEYNNLLLKVTEFPTESLLDRVWIRNEIQNRLKSHRDKYMTPFFMEKDGHAEYICDGFPQVSTSEFEKIPYYYVTIAQVGLSGISRELFDFVILLQEIILDVYSEFWSTFEDGKYRDLLKEKLESFKTFDTWFRDNARIDT